MIVCKWVWFILMFAVLQEESGAKSQTGEKRIRGRRRRQGTPVQDGMAKLLLHHLGERELQTMTVHFAVNTCSF